ncbi:Zinc ABC transporter, inner membrane permease protein ZnuB [Chitinispirillum alkaliphilum]|nr:Zinc ABC transporter, inner membrane permease protein ZnuB [Chitinispirillum alkaliphilum]
MSDFLFTLSFSVIPLLTVLTFALMLPAIGTTLSLRNEILLGIALPPLGTAVMAIAIFLGVSPDSTVSLYLITAGGLLLMLYFMPDKQAQISSIRRREQTLAALFCGANAFTIFFMAMSGHAESRFHYLLQGEMLAVTSSELIFTLVCCTFFSLLFFSFRGAVYALCLDQQQLAVKQHYYKLILNVYRVITVLVITGSIILVGPLLTASMLILPPFLIEKRSRGLDSFLMVAVAVSVLSVFAGFGMSIVVDLPPAPIIIISLLTVCALWSVWKRILTKNRS